MDPVDPDPDPQHWLSSIILTQGPVDAVIGGFARLPGLRGGEQVQPMVQEILKKCSKNQPEKTV